MIHPLSRATTYIETYVMRADNGQELLRAYATGFFVRTSHAILLVTNWHVVTGLDPSKPSMMLSDKPTPSFMKLTVPSIEGQLHELTLPLYDQQMNPLWKEHPEGPAVDLVVYQLPLALESYFVFADIQTLIDGKKIDETVAKDVFILGHPFSKNELQSSFGNDAPYFFPAWKRGSIATEPRLRIGGRILLIDSLSRPGMSGAPVLIAQDEKVLLPGSKRNAAVFEKMRKGIFSGLRAILALDAQNLTSSIEKRFNFLGVYSGVIGKTRLDEVALGICWHADTLRELIANVKAGVMPYHSPMQNEFYEKFLARLDGGKLIKKNAEGQIIEEVPLFD